MFKTRSSVFIHRGNLNNSQRILIRYPLNVCFGHASKAMLSVFALFGSFGFLSISVFGSSEGFFLAVLLVAFAKHKTLLRGRGVNHCCQACK